VADLGLMWEEALAVAGGAIAGWLIAEFAGGVEGWRQRRILRYLEIARELDGTPEGAEARKLAIDETGRLIASKGTTWRLWAWGLVAGLMTLFALLTILEIVMDVATDWIDLERQTVMSVWVLLGEVTFLAVAAGMQFRRVRAVRRSKVPRPPSRIVSAR